MIHANDEYEAELIAVWPDGTWCYHSDLYDYLQHKSDDYEIHEVVSWYGPDSGYAPKYTRPLLWRA